MSEFIIWIIYDHPKDYPDYFIARKWDYKENMPTDEIIKNKMLEPIRRQLFNMGLAMLPRDPRDDECIVESWI